MPDEATLAAVDEAEREDGQMLCPEGGAVLAACIAAVEQGLISKSDRVVLFNCATGLKYPMEDKSLQLDLADGLAGLPV